MRPLPSSLAWLLCAALSGCGGGGGPVDMGPAEGEGEGEGEGAGESRPDAYVEDQEVFGRSKEVDADDPDDMAVISSPLGRAKLFLPPETLSRNAKIYIFSRPLSEFSGTSAIIDGVYTFEGFYPGAEDRSVAFERPVQIVLPLNGLALWRPDQLELVSWPVSGQGWETVRNAIAAVVDDRAAAWVGALGTYGLRVTGGFSELAEEIPVEGPVLGNCPPVDAERGSALGKVLQDPKLKDPDGVEVPLYGFCGNKAILIVSAGMW